MNSIFKKYLSKTLLLITLAGLTHSCVVNDDVEPEPTPEAKPIQLSVGLHNNANKDVDTRANENPGQENEIYSLEVFVFKPSGELDGHKLVIPSVQNVAVGTANKYYDKEYVHVSEINGIELTAGERHLYVIANPPLTKNGSQYESVLKPKLSAGSGSYSSFKTLYAELEDQGYIASPGVRFDNTEGSPIGGIDPTGLQTALTMVGYEKITLSNQHTKHYLGYSGNGKPGGGSIDDSTEKVIRTGTFEVERLVARVMLKKVDFNFTTITLGGETFDKEDITAYLDDVFMVDVQSQVLYDEASGSIGGQYKYGYKTGYDFLSSSLGLSPSGTLFAPSEPKTTLLEKISAPSYDVDDNSSPIWFYTFENQSTYPTYMVVGIKYNFKKSNNTKWEAKYYYPIKVNDGTTTADHTQIKKNYQYRITVTIKGLTGAYKESENSFTRSVGDNSDLSESMIVECEVGREIFPWTGNLYY